MSYTIQATPPSYSSLHGDLIFTVAYPEHTSDPVTYPNFKFVGDIYIGGVLVARLKKIPNPDTNIGVFNIGQIVRNYVAFNFNPDPVDIIAQTMGNGEFTLDVVMKFGEEYSYTIYTNLVVDSTRTYFNNYNGRLTGTSSVDGMINKPATTRPYATPIRCDSKFNFIPIFYTEPSFGGSWAITIRAYDYSNTNVNTAIKFLTPTENLLHIVNLSKDAINDLSAGTINATIKYYTVEFNDGIIYRFNMECECIHDKYTLHFLNKFGGFESKDFVKVSRKTIQIDKKDFGKLPYTVDSSGVVSYKNSNNVYNESRSVYSSQFKERMTLNSDLLTDGEYSWLEELVLSPMVYMEQDGNFLPVVITENNYEPKKVVNDDLTNLTISIEFGQQLNTQYR